MDNLESLRQAMIEDARRAEQYAEDNSTSIKKTALDWTSLPTFGGDEPKSTLGVWSWDETRLLIGTCTDDLKIVLRADYE
jgi:hypothetical protein